jgi:hypothetical protein
MNILAIQFSDYILDIFTLFFLERKRGEGYIYGVLNTDSYTGQVYRNVLFIFKEFSIQLVFTITRVRISCSD